MNRYILIRRLYGPAFLLLVGVMALLHEADILNWGQTWPFLLILLGVLKLAERAALAADGYPQWPAAPQQPVAAPAGQYPGAQYQAPPQTNPPAASAAPVSAIVPSIPVEIVKSSEGGEQ